MRDYEQNSAEVTSLNAASELTLVTSMREPYLTKLDLKTELGESFEVTVLGKSGARGCSVFCKPTTILPESVTVGSRLEIFLKSDRVPVATKMLVRSIETGYADINWDVIDMLYGEKGARVHSAPNLALVPANPATKSLNSGQREVLAHYLSDKHNDARIVAVESPPGSGKTSVAVAMVRSFRAEGTQVVISAANEPMYNFLEKLSEIGVRDKRVVHLIAPSREVTRPSPYSLLADQSGDHHDRFVELREDYTGAARKDKRRIKKELFRIHNETLKSTALSPNVVVGTVDAILAKVMASGSDAIQQALRNVTRIIIDESSQLTEAAFNAIILRFAKAKIFLIGDSKQLPPFRYEKGELISELAARSSLDVVRACMNFPVIKFRFVYRAAACLIGPASEIFYGGRLVSMKPLSAVNPVRCYTSDNETRCVLIKVEGKAKRSGKS